MPLIYPRRLTGSERSESANRHLARILAFVAGAVNAGGFFRGAAVHFAHVRHRVRHGWASGISGSSLRLPLPAMLLLMAAVPMIADIQHRGSPHKRLASTIIEL